ncbi:MAG: four helix bundle protein [Longimicrobiales bacterium]|nr:four helix bundle protein [Longimicrobiales bacterium]
MPDLTKHGPRQRRRGTAPALRDWDAFDPEQLPAYRLARRHTRAVRALLEKADTRGYSDLVNQIRRSAASITGNIREGYGEESPGRKAQYYGFAKGSVAETWGHVDNLVDFGCIEAADTGEVRNLQNQLIALLWSMIKTQRSRTD